MYAHMYLDGGPQSQPPAISDVQEDNDNDIRFIHHRNEALSLDSLGYKALHGEVDLEKAFR